ncbi:MAG TPA: ATP-dependent DNA ligase, partial [Kineosporiaceae bacterium]|nr:ATP-dependent DNA ligase [Kineosporiaceae bacterium]
MLLARIAVAYEAVSASSGRRAKIDLLADCLREADDDEVGVVVSWLSGRTRQRRTGIGWASLRVLPPPAERAGLTVRMVDDVLAQAAGAGGTGSQASRQGLLAGLLAAATAPEQRLLSGLISGELRQGAQAGVVLEAVASAAGVPAEAVRRAVTLRGDLAAV